jgi:hypothetical protein
MAGESDIQVGNVTFRVEAVRSPARHVSIHGVVVETLNIATVRPRDLSQWSHLADIAVTNVDIDDVTILIGANVPDVQIQLESRIGKPGEPFAVRTVLGWSIFGPTDREKSPQGQRKVGVNAVNVACSDSDNIDIDQQMRQFLDLDSLGISEKPGTSVEDRRAWSMLEESTRRIDGRYQVGMLWKCDNPCLPDNRSTAEARLTSLGRKLQRDPKLHSMYADSMTKLFDKGYAVELTEDEAARHTDKTWYLPHHAVFHPRKPDKIRVVFDAASQHHGVSLNSQLLSGPDLINSLLGILLRFRERPVAIVGDIEGFFSQIAVPEEDTESLRFLYWKDGLIDGPTVEAKMLRHVFGAKCSPTCCNYALKRLARDSDEISDAARETVLNSFYVDDLIDALQEGDVAMDRIVEVTERLREDGKLRITGWLSNDRDVLASVPEAERAQAGLDLDLDNLPVSRALGVEWDVKDDVFKFSTTDNIRHNTKRGVLSTLSSLFDPLGLVCPVILRAKNIMQRLWRSKVGWDDALPETELAMWKTWKAELLGLNNVRIPRCHVAAHLEVQEVSLHHFSDASENGYGMCAYLRFVYANGEIRCSFLVGRSRCAPLKIASIPRLELQSAVLSVRIYQTIRSEITYSLTSIHFWSDSQTVLKYIDNESKRFNVYVANRVAEIREATSPDQWRHCPGKVNPADDASRGLSPTEIEPNHRWWHGPGFLWCPEDSWPSAKMGPLSDDDPEVKRGKAVYVTTEPQNEPGGLEKLIEECEDWSELKEKTAWVMSMGKTGPVPANVSAADLERAEEWIVKVVQEECFGPEIARLEAGHDVRAGSSIISLRPTLVDGVLRVGGRLENAPTLSDDEKYPLIMPKKNRVSVLIMRTAHCNLAHAGREQTLADTRRKFWILGGRSLAKKVVRECVDCRRRNARPLQQLMAGLPQFRLEPYKPSFSYCGIDLFGPLLVKWGRSGTAKRWGCLFTCLTTRAVYLDIVPSLSTQDFILLLRQFISRRGPPEEIRTDNGTNFTGAERELREAIGEWNQKTIQEELQQKGIRWLFQPPTAAHMSGVWERLVQTSKRHLKALSGDRLMTEYGLRTLFAEVEAIMNGRPLCPVSEDPKDFESLTPNHFLMHRKVTGLPPGIFVKEDYLLTKEWKKIQYLLDLYWQRWLKEYLPGLQNREKWRKERRNVRVGDLVLLVEDGVKRGQWPSGRVTKVMAGADNLVRSAIVKTPTSELHRPITKICLLEAVE